MRYAFHNGIKVRIAEGVYEPAEDTYLILDNVNERGPGMALDVGTGSGIIAIWLAKLGFTVVATDVDVRALKCAKENAKLNNVKLDLVRCDLAEPIKGKFDVITFNPPYLPFKDNIPEEIWWYGGKNILWRFLKRDLPRVLKRDGRLYLVYSSLTGIKDPKEILPEGFRAEIMIKNHVGLLPIIKNEKVVGVVTRTDLLKTISF